MQIRHYTLAIWHSFWLLLLGTGACAGATYIISNNLKPVYQASALIQVNESGSNNNSNVFTDQALAVSESILVTSPDVLEKAARALPGISAGQLKKLVSASPISQTEIIEVQAEADTAQQASEIANEVAKVFIQVQVARKDAQLQETLDQISQQLATTKANIDAAQVQLNSLHKSGASADKIASQNAVLSGYQANYNAQLSSYQQTQLEKTQVGSILTEIQSANPPDAPVSPRVMLNTIIAAALGLLLMIVLVLLLDWVDATIKTPEDVAQLALLEPLGSVPLSKQPLLLTNPVGASSTNEATEQAFIAISTNFNASKKDRRAILVTGLHVNSGVSTTASRLALLLAQSGLRVLLIDAHMHRPSLHEAFNPPNGKGLSNSLNDVYVIQDQPGLIHSWLTQWATNVPNLWLLPSGPDIKEATAVLRSRELRTLIEWLLLQQQAPSGQLAPSAVDIVLFDAPSFEEGIDTMTLAPVADGTVLVIDAAKERSEMLNKARATLEKLGAPVLGVVVNRQKAHHRPYFYTDRFQQARPESAIAEFPVKYPLLKIRALSSETPSALLLSVQVPQAEASSLQDRYDIAQQLVPQTPRPVDRRMKGVFKSAMQPIFRVDSPGYDDQDGWKQ